MRGRRQDVGRRSDVGKKVCCRLPKGVERGDEVCKGRVLVRARKEKGEERDEERIVFKCLSSERGHHVSMGIAQERRKCYHIEKSERDRERERWSGGRSVVGATKSDGGL